MVVSGIQSIIESGKLSSFRGCPEGQDGGYWVQALEAAFKEYFNVKYAVSMNSATSCLHSALIACGIGEGDEVIVSPYTFSSSASCTLMVKAKPIFCDIEDETFCIDVDKIEANPKAIIPVDLCGHPADYDKIRAKFPKAKIIEDAAQAIGAKYKGKWCGTLGDCGIFSFNQSKQINVGEGGILLTNDDWINRVCRAMRNHGEVSDPELKMVGYNYRMCEIQAYHALEQFKKLDENIERRIELTSYMTKFLSQIEGFIPPVVKPDCKHSFYTYAVKYLNGNRDELQDALIKRGIYFGKGYVKPLYLLPIYGRPKGLCPVTERMYESSLMVTDIFKSPMTKSDCDIIKAGILDTLKCL